MIYFLSKKSILFSDELSILPHSQSDPVSLQPTKASDLLLQTVIPEVDEPVKPTEPIVIEANGPALMQESDECPILGIFIFILYYIYLS